MPLNEFFAVIFETLGYQDNFSNDLFSEDLYALIGLINVITSLVLVLVFYFVINRPSFSRWQHWSIMLLINLLIAFVVGLIIPQNVFYELFGEGMYGVTEYILFAFKNTILALVFFIIWTYCFKWWYGNARGTPKFFLGKF